MKARAALATTLLVVLASGRARAAEVDVFVSGGAADIEWGHRALGGGVRLTLGRWFLEPAYLDVRSDRTDDVHNGLALQAGVTGRGRARSLYFGIGAKFEAENLLWASTGVRFRLGRGFVLAPEVRLGAYQSEPAQAYLQGSLSVGASFELK